MWYYMFSGTEVFHKLIRKAGAKMIATVIGVRHVDFVSKDEKRGTQERVVGDSLQIVKAPAPDDVNVSGQLVDKVFLREGNPLIGKAQIGVDNEFVYDVVGGKRPRLVDIRPVK